MLMSIKSTFSNIDEMNLTILGKYSSPAEDVSVNKVRVQKDWDAILTDLRSEATEEVSIACQSWGTLTLFPDMSDVGLLYTHYIAISFLSQEESF